MAPFKAVLALCAALLGLHTLFSVFSADDTSVLADNAVANNYVQVPFDDEAITTDTPPPPPKTKTHVTDAASLPEGEEKEDPFAHIEVDVGLADKLPSSRLLHHADGWTVFRDVYLSNGTLFVITADRSGWPDRKMMTSTGLPGFNTPENIAARMPTDYDLSFITPAEAERLWGRPSARSGTRNKVWTITGNTIIFNDPIQFLDHYYHYVAELWFGTWATWHGTFPSANLTTPRTLPHRAFLPHVEYDEWHDRPGFNGYFQRAFLPSFTLETAHAWRDRTNATRDLVRAYHLPHLLLVDRSASFRGEIVGEVHRTAAAAWYPLARAGRLGAGWWEPARRAVLAFAGVPRAVLDYARPGAAALALLPDDARLARGLEAGNKRLRGEGKWHAADWEARLERDAAARTRLAAAAPREAVPAPVVVSYISRQKSRRRLREPDASALEGALAALCARRGWELNVALAEKLSIDEQFALAARTTVMLGVHGNGLSHLLWMPPRPDSTVIELFYPDGFAHDYEWTARALGHRHFGVWNDTSFTWPDTPWVAYPDGFQGTEIPVHAPTVVDIIERRIDGRL